MELGVKLSGTDLHLEVQLPQWNSFLGYNPDYLLAFGADRHWSDPTGEFIWAAGLTRYLRTGLPVVASIPLCPEIPGALAEVVAGKRDGEFKKAAVTLAGRIQRLRIGWECNGKGQGWGRQMVPDDAQYRAAYERVTDLFLSVSPDWHFIWGVLADPHDDRGFPGRFPTKNVHGIEIDLYWYPEHSSTNPDTAFTLYREGRVGLESVRRLAEANRLPWGIGEWGVRPHGGRFVELFASYLKAHPEIAYHCYWDDNATFTSKISSGQSGSTGDAYRLAFGPPIVDPKDQRISELEAEAVRLQEALKGCDTMLQESEVRAAKAVDELARIRTTWKDLTARLEQ